METHNPVVNPRESEMPTIFEIFSTIRRIAAELAIQSRDPRLLNHKNEDISKNLLWFGDRLNDIGDYDEPLVALINGALDLNLTEENKNLLKRIAS